MASGCINLQANDGKVAGIVFEDGASANVSKRDRSIVWA